MSDNTNKLLGKATRSIATGDYVYTDDIDKSVITDTTPTSVRQILKQYNELDNLALRGIVPDKSGVPYLTLDQALAAIAAYYEGLVPEKLEYDPNEASDWIAEGFNQAIDTIKRNFTGQTDTERKDSRI